MSRSSRAAVRPDPALGLKRKLAAVACYCCRSRNIVCDGVETERPCMNCRLNNTECVVDDLTKLKRVRKEDPANQSRTSWGRKADRVSMFPLPEERPVTSRDHSLTTALYGPLDRAMSHGDPTNLNPGHPGNLNARRSSPVESPPESRHSLSSQHDPELGLPKFIRELPLRIPPEDIGFLRNKGALTIPEAELRDELLRKYVQYVHPLLPVLDLEEFLVSVERNDGSGRVSLLLFQAVMFAATAYVEMRFLSGYANRVVARRKFFQKAKCLFDLDCEPDRVSVVQALLLMTSWFDTPTDQKDAWHWMGIGLSLANSIGLNQNPEKSTMALKQQRLWKRTWWCCFMRDRLIALGLQKPPRIRDNDFDVPMLVLDDFEVRSLPSEAIQLLGDCTGVQDIDFQDKRARLCIETVRLCGIIGHVLAVQYDVLGRRFGISTETTMMLMPKTSASGIFQVMECDQELDRWHENLTNGIEYKNPESLEEIAERDAGDLNLHRALLAMLYLTVSSALHRPQLHSALPSSAVAASLLQLSRKRVKEAATRISQIAADLYELDLIRFLPPTGVTVLVPAILVHLSDIGSKDEIVRSNGVRQSRACILSLRRLREIYSSADFALSVVETAYHNANVDMPLDADERESTASGTRGRPENQTGVTTSYHDGLAPLRNLNVSEICSNLTMTAGDIDMLLNPPVIDLTAEETSVPDLTFVSEDSFRDLINAPAANDFLYRQGQLSASVLGSMG